jgi:hypothetical protein
LRNKNYLFKPQRGDINIAWGNAPGNPSYDRVEYSRSCLAPYCLGKKVTSKDNSTQRREIGPYSNLKASKIIDGPKTRLKNDIKKMVKIANLAPFE